MASGKWPVASGKVAVVVAGSGRDSGRVVAVAVAVVVVVVGAVLVVVVVQRYLQW